VICTVGALNVGLDKELISFIVITVHTV